MGMNNIKPSIDVLMAKMPESWRFRWCEGIKTGCACLGCANVSGGLVRQGFTKKEWEEWVKRQRENELQRKG